MDTSSLPRQRVTDTRTSNRPTCFSGNSILGTCCLFLTALASDHSVDKELPTFTHKGHHVLLQSSTQQLLLQYCHYNYCAFSPSSSIQNGKFSTVSVLFISLLKKTPYHNYENQFLTMSVPYYVSMDDLLVNIANTFVFS